MFDRTKITDNLYGLVGYDVPPNPKYNYISEENQESRSERRYTDNPLCKIEWFVDNSDYPGDINDQLTKLSSNSITSVADKVFNRPDYIDRQILFQQPNNKINTDSLPADNFVGYRILTSLKKNVAFKITRIFLEFEGTGDLTLYLFNTAEKLPIQTQVISITDNNQSYNLNWIVDYSSVDYYKGEFYLGYLSNEASNEGLEPIKRDYQGAEVKSIITYLDFENINVPNVTTAELWDLEDKESAEETWGLNPDITVYDDFTNLIIQNEMLFARAIQLEGQIAFLSIMNASIRSNINERFSKDFVNKILIELEGIQDTNKKGIKTELLKEISHIRKEIKKLQEGYFATKLTLNTLT